MAMPEHKGLPYGSLQFKIKGIGKPCHTFVFAFTSGSLINQLSKLSLVLVEL